MATLSAAPLNTPYITLLSFSCHDNASRSREYDCLRSYCLDEDNKPIFIEFAMLASVLLLLFALLAGLTLAICSLDIIWLQVHSMTGNEKQRNQALVVSRIKRNGSWFLCAMSICSVACAWSLLFLIQLLFDNSWPPIFISTIAIVVLAEVLPQYFIPQNAIFWGYYCWPFIWFCMWLTCIISWPLSYSLDKIAGPPVDRGIYTMEQLGILIKFHERAEKHGGLLGPDAGRVMRGALDLDHRTLRGDCQLSFEKDKALLTDVEKGETLKSEIIVPWSSVRCVSVNEEVTKDLVQRIKGWAYSRIPVVGDLEAACSESAKCCAGWEDQKVYGFLHVKNLVGLELQDGHSQLKRIFVKDLPLYPLPIVRDDLPLYDLLNVFQLGMARMAVVIPKPAKDQIAPLSASAKNEDALPRHGAPLWSASRGLNTRSSIEIGALEAHVDWTTDFLKAAQNDLELTQHRKHHIIGIGCPKPIGIVTYEDVLDALLQKTSLDEKDFFRRDNLMPPTKCRKEGDDNSVSSNHSIVRSRKIVPTYVRRLHAAFESSGENKGTLRRRNIPEPDDCIDGASELSRQGFDGTNDPSIALHVDAINRCSSYTESGFGDFLYTNGSNECNNDLILRPLERTVDSETTPTFSAPATSVTVATRKASRWYPRGTTSIGCRQNYNSVTVHPRFRRVNRFSTKTSELHERTEALERCEQTTSTRIPSINIQDNVPTDRLDHGNPFVADSSGTLNHHSRDATRAPSACPWDQSGLSASDSRHCSIDSLDRVLAVVSNHTAIVKGWTTGNSTCSLEFPLRNEKPSVGGVILNTRESDGVKQREESFHDDLTFLPSQRKHREKKSPSVGRRISFWL